MSRIDDLVSARDVESLIAALKDSNMNVRKGAAWGLGKLKDSRAVEPLIKTLKDNDGSVRREAAGVLGELKDSRAIKPLIAAMKDSETEVCAAVAGALVKIGDARTFELLIPALKDRNKNLRFSAVCTIASLGDTRAVELLIALLKIEKDPNIRARAVDALGSLKDARAVEPIIAALEDSDWNVRVSAAMALGYINDSRTVEPLLATLTDNVERVRCIVVRALGGLRISPVVEPLLITAVNDSSVNVRGYANEALVKIGAPAIDPLIAVLKDSNRKGDLRVHAAKSLGELKDARAVKPLLAALKDDYKLMCFAAVEALDQLGWIPDQGEDGETYLAVKREKNLCNSCRKEEGIFRCTRCNGRYCERCIQILGEEVANFLVERVHNVGEVFTFGTVKILDDQGRAFCPGCFQPVLEDFKKLGLPNDIQNLKDIMKPTCKRIED